jgi:hypothetical protein
MTSPFDVGTQGAPISTTQDFTETQLMVNQPSAVSIPKTPQELEQAIQRYRSSDLSGNELFNQWQAIRTAALELRTAERSDRVPGEDSY